MIQNYTIESFNDTETVVNVNGKTMTFNCEPIDLVRGSLKYETGSYIQDAFPFLNAEEREFLMTGINPELWANLFPVEDEDV